MSDNEAPKPKITSDVKEKNPGRVAAGKKLAAMNRARMSRTSNHHDTTEPVQRQVEQTVAQRQSHDHDHDTTNWSSPMVLLTVIGVVSGLGCLYYTYKQDKRSETSSTSQIRASEEPEQSIPLSSSGGNLKSFD